MIAEKLRLHHVPGMLADVYAYAVGPTHGVVLDNPMVTGAR